MSVLHPALARGRPGSGPAAPPRPRPTGVAAASSDDPVAAPAVEDARARAPRLGVQPAVVVALGVGAVGATILAWMLPAIATVDPTPLALFVVLVVAARVGTLPLYQRSTYSVSTVPVLAAAMLLGAPGAVVVALVSGVGLAIVDRPAWYKAVFNCGNYVLAAAAAAMLFHGAGGRVALDDLPRLTVLAVVTGLAHYPHLLLTSLAIAAEHRASPRRVWGDHFAWLWPQYAVSGLLALLLALAYHEFGLAGSAAFVAPPVLMLYTAKQYIDRTSAGVRELRRANDQLTAVNGELTTVNAHLRDEIRQRAEAEAEVARLAQQAARADALEELSQLKSRFVAVASHELRTPLTGVIGYAELALSATPPDDPRHDLLARTHRSAEQLAALVDQLLDASRIETGRMTIEPAAVDLMAAVPAVLEALGGASAKHALAAGVAPEARWVRADPERLRQILTNLVGNAVKYSPAGGQVLVATRPAAGGRVELSVTDQGLGIPPEELGSIFDPYQRASLPASRRIKGTGLGLYIVRQLVELHGGTIRVESVVGRGSTFVVALPVADPPSDPS